MWGVDLFPWQQHILDVAHERDPHTGEHAYDTVVLIVGRRAGKSIGALAQDWTFAARPDWWSPQTRMWRSAYTAQNALGAIKRLRQTWEMFTENAPASMRAVSRELRGVSHSSVEMRYQGAERGSLNPNRSRIAVFAPTRHGLRGDSYAVAKIDEATALSPADGEALQDAVRPTLADQRGQLWWLSNLALEDGGFLPLLMQRGRAAVDEHRTHGIAYFEWSAPEGADVTDPLVWRDAHPSIGNVLTEHRLRRELEEQGPTRFAAEYLNMPDAAGTMLTPSMLSAVHGEVGIPRLPVWLAVDITPDRLLGSLAVAWRGDDGRPRGGLLWTGDPAELPGIVAEAQQRYEARVLYDPVVSAAAARPDWQRITASQYAEACSRLVDLIRTQRVVLREDPALTRAVAGAQARALGDGWVWGRRRSRADITSLVALTLALLPITDDHTPVMA